MSALWLVISKHAAYKVKNYAKVMKIILLFLMKVDFDVYIGFGR